MDERARINLSKKMTYLLRHKEGFTDREGWVDIDELLRALRRWYPWVTKGDIIYVVAHDDKGRYELKGNLIRARYGHTTNVEIKLPLAKEDVLYHGTSCISYRKIIEEGIKPMKRRKVHLTRDLNEAIDNARRKGSCIKILIIDTQCLKDKGYLVYEAGKNVRVTDYVPPECIKGVLTPKSRVSPSREGRNRGGRVQL